MAHAVAIDQFSEKLRAYIQSGNLNFLIGSGASFPAIRLASGVEDEINLLLEFCNEDQANQKALEFIENLESQNAQIFSDKPTPDVEKTYLAYQEFLGIVDSILFERKTSLLPRQATIFTTNYDLFFECAASEIPNLVLNDGFDRTSPAAQDYRFTPEQFFDRVFRSGLVFTRQEELPTINLVKLHGSLNWARTENAILYREATPQPLSEDARQDQESIKAALGSRAVILPNLRKFHSTLLDRTYYDQLRIFSNALEKENALLMCFGFSFADEHIQDLTRRSLRNPTSELVVFCYDESSVPSYIEKFAKNRNVTVVYAGGGQKIDFSVLNATLRQQIEPTGDIHD